MAGAEVLILIFHMFAPDVGEAMIRPFKRSEFAKDIGSELKSWEEWVRSKYPPGIQKGTLTYLFDSRRLIETGDSQVQLELANCFLRPRMPSYRLWLAVITDNWQWKRMELGKDATEFFQEELPVILPYLEDLAKRLQAACEKNRELFQRELLAKTAEIADDLKEVGAGVKEFGADVKQMRLMVQEISEQNALMIRASLPEVSNRPWKLRYVINELSLNQAAPAEALQREMEVAGELLPDLDRSWHDPQVKVAGIWKAGEGQTITCSDTFALHPLCIPAYSVSVEWRLKSYVQGDPLWGRAKRTVVARFLKLCQGKHLVFQVVAIKAPHRGGRVMLHSPDYTSFLQQEWHYYKGLEIALAQNSFYRFCPTQTSTGPTFKFLKNLVDSREIIKLVPEYHYQNWGGREAQVADLRLVFEGLCKREVSRIPRLRRHRHA